MSREPNQTSLTTPLLVWFTPQIVALALSAVRVPVSAHPPRPIESLTLTQLAVVQIITAALFAPILFRSIQSTIAVVITAAPLLQIAGFLSQSTFAQENAAYQSGSSWAIALGLVCMTIRAREKLTISALATTWSLGGLILAYLQAEFAPSRTIPEILFGPAAFVIKITRSPAPPHHWWLPVAAIPLVALMIACACRLIQRSNPSQETPVEESGNPPPPVAT